MFERASKLKLLTLVETMLDVDINKIKRSKAIKSTDYMEIIKKGYVDLQNVKESCGTDWFDGCIRELVRIGLVERIKMNYLPNQQAQLLRLSDKGKIFATFLNRKLV